ncbi:EamA family transporter RarD [Pseudoclavibacter soli]|uniref:EamA family transporter RarD n=1 Tax=Pseudoclavibacter soli TaxID=452623 RepID=UPI0004163F19|nr:EamA family transporter RarD [Pseudoclavibacter soli]
MSAAGSAPRTARRSGLAYGLITYLIWGVLPLYFVAMSPTGPFELVSARVVFSALFCALLVMFTRAWRVLGEVFRSPRTLGLFALAAGLIYLNWQLYVIAATSGHVLEASLGYFINPVFTVLLAVLVQRERLTVAQWSAVGISALAVLVLAVAYGQVPWIGLGLALSFGFYGLIKARVGGQVDSLTGLTVETTLLLPVATVVLVLVQTIGGGLTFGSSGVGHSLLLASTGIVTAVPLLTFASASRRLPLAWLGFLQYLGPVLQFTLGVAVLREDMPPARWAGFALIWLAIVVLIVDGARQARAHRVY